MRVIHKTSFKVITKINIKIILALPTIYLTNLLNKAMVNFITSISDNNTSLKSVTCNLKILITITFITFLNKTPEKV